MPGLGAGITQPTRTIFVRGVHFPQPGFAEIVQGLPALTQASTSEVLLEVVIDQALPGLTQAAILSDEIDVAIAQVLPALAQDATAFAGVEGEAEIAQVLPALTQRARGFLPNIALPFDGFEGFEVARGSMGYGRNRRQKDFATGQGRSR